MWPRVDVWGAVSSADTGALSSRRSIASGGRLFAINATVQTDVDQAIASRRAQHRAPVTLGSRRVARPSEPEPACHVDFG